MRETLHSLTDPICFITINFESTSHYMHEFIRYNNYYYRYSLVDVIYDYISHCHIIGVQSSMLRDCAYEKYYMSYWRLSKYNECYGRRSLRDLV